MNKTEFINAIAAKEGLEKKYAEHAVNAVFSTLTQELAKGEKIQLVGFGTFEVKQRAERTARNPQTGEPTTVPATKVPSFKAGKALKDAVK